MPCYLKRCCLASLLSLGCCALLLAAEEQQKPDSQARQLLLRGRYAEAAEQYQKLAESHPLVSDLGVARSLIAQGKYDAAEKLLQTAEKKFLKDSRPSALLAQLSFERGNYQAAEKQATEAIARDKNNLQARWVQAELWRAGGKLKQANDAYSWFVDYYNNSDAIDRAEDLHAIGLAAGQFARWNRLSDQFSFLVNDLYLEIVKSEKNYWQAHYEAGRLFLEKFNQAEASKSLSAALAINPNAADVHAAVAELAIQSYQLESARRSLNRALEINPSHFRAKMLMADLELANFEPNKAVKQLEQTVRLNAVSEEVLGRLAASYAMADGVYDPGQETRLGKLIAEVTQRNPHCGLFYYELSLALDKGRKFPQAAMYLHKAVEVMPQLVGPRGQLGLMYMRLGDEERAKKILSESFEIDPFNVRVSNSLKVLEVLDGYQTLETEHFIIRYDGQKDALLARYVAEYLEEIYPELCKQLDYEPQQKSLFEIFNNAKNTSGHGWFSARMVGLPRVHTIAACAGKMVALTSPGSMKQQFNWARVLKHEFVHVINLQQTNFNIPHWFTEALAVHSEGQPRSTEWNEMLARRVPAGKTFNLQTINFGFIRPGSSEDWQMAYCQAELYAEYIIEKHGEQAIGKMLASYRDNLTTAETILASCGVTQAEFEKGYREYLEAIVRNYRVAEEHADLGLEELAEKLRKNPQDLDVQAALAKAYLLRKKNSEAGKLAKGVLDKDPDHQLATYVRAKLLISIGEARTAHDLLAKNLDEKKPQSDLLKLLAGLKYRARQYQQAEKLYKLGLKHDPHNPAWSKALAMVYLKNGDTKSLRGVLRELALADGDDLVMRKKLAQLAFAAADYRAAGRWARECIQIDVYDADIHELFAKALSAEKKHAQAAAQFRTVVELKPNDKMPRLALAESLLSAEKLDEAKKVLGEYVQTFGKDEQVTKLQQRLEK